MLCHIYYSDSYMTFEDYGRVIFAIIAVIVIYNIILHISNHINKHNKPSISIDEAIAIAKAYHLEEEVTECIKRGMSPIEALIEWDLI